ncbi:CBS domain-containing protein [Sabulicella rubraurantiaca]|uniref:CBS domain-containing protein n=1 Tax=Sabulicella rubraurantiaca TaxID=2811429 RepID=UPI001A96944D|nr:CBS domain-containing protein [Sabulicella rubraurantiaca]
MNAKELMSTALVVVPPEMPVTAVAELLAGRGISAAPVVGPDGAPLGIVTEGDLIRRLAEEPRRGPVTWFFDMFRDKEPAAQRFAKARGRTARDVMSKDLVTVTGDAPADRIARLMEQRNIRRVLVVEGGKLAGLVSRADLLRALLHQVETENRTESATAAGRAGNDAGLLRAVTDALHDQPWTDTFWVYPHVANGVVTLHGFARSDAARGALRVLAEGVPGVASVVDKLAPMPLLLRITR